MYHNEKEVGSSILSFLSSSANSAGLKREDIHFTSKLASNSGYDAARKSIEQSLKQCGLGYIDLFLLHSPYGGKAKRLESWRAVEDAITAGDIRTGGVSNFGVKHVWDEACTREEFNINLHSCKSFWLPILESNPRSTRWRSTPLTPGPGSRLFVNSTISWSKPTPLWHEPFA